MAGQGNLIPVYQEFLADTEPPVSACLILRTGDSGFRSNNGKRGFSTCYETINIMD
jgi:hypothetical protein